MAAKRKYYQKCFVPYCKSSTVKTPNKTFLYVPECLKTRKLWLLAVGRTDDRAGTVFCCEDHFNLKEDLNNYDKYLKGVGQKRIKKGIIPHLNLYKSKEEGIAHFKRTKNDDACSNQHKYETIEPVSFESDKLEINSTSHAEQEEAVLSNDLYTAEDGSEIIDQYELIQNDREAENEKKNHPSSSTVEHVKKIYYLFPDNGKIKNVVVTLLDNEY